MRRSLSFTALAVAILALPACGPNPSATQNAGTSNASTQNNNTKPTDDGRKYPPCHPGCFPAGTLVVTPSGLREIQTIRKSEMVTLVTAEGTTITGSVEDLFTAPNRLIEVRTDGGTATTTDTQPLCRTTGGFALAGDLKPGDTIWRWENGERKSVTVKQVSSPAREADVFNLVVGKDKVFIAGGFLARGKPPVTP